MDPVSPASSTKPPATLHLRLPPEPSLLPLTSCCVASLTGEIAHGILQMAMAKYPPCVAPMHVLPACMAK